MTEETVAENVTLEADYLTSLPELKPAKRPAEQSQEYQFFINTDTGQMWKAKMVLIEDEEGRFAANSVHVSITVSPVDEAGKALRDETDRPIVTDSLTHVFNEVEMSVPDFDPQARMMQIVAERIKIGEARLVGIDKVKALAEKWTGKGMFN